MYNLNSLPLGTRFFTVTPPRDIALPNGVDEVGIIKTPDGKYRPVKVLSNRVVMPWGEDVMSEFDGAKQKVIDFCKLFSVWSLLWYRQPRAHLLRESE